MNVSQFPLAQTTPIQHVLTEAQEEDANFLSFKLLNNRARVRLSPEPFDLQPLPGKAHLLSVANHKGWFVAVSRTSTQTSLILSPLSDLRAAFDSTPQDGAILFDPKRSFSLSMGIPNALAFASNDTRLLVGLIQGQILVYDTSHLFTPGTDSFPPLHVFQTSILTASRQILPNPGDMPDLVAVLREPDGTALTQAVEILDVNNMTSIGAWTSGNTPSTTPMSISWSPKGKQIAIGLQSGDILTFSPSSTSTVKALVSKPPSADDQAVVATTWLSNPSFHAIYAPPTPINPDAEQLHYVVTLDSKKGSVTDIKLGAPCLPYPGLRPPGSFILTLRNWEPSRFLLCVGDSASSDIGVLGSVASSTDSSGEVWHNFSLEETGRPSMPLDKDMNDTVLVGLELDLTSSQSFRHTGVSGEALELPPPPIIYAYASDGTVLGWYVVNSQGTPYPGMMTPSAVASISSSIHDTSISPRAQPESISTSLAPAPSDIMSTTPISVFDSGSTFGQPSLGAVSTFGQQASSFGQVQPAASSFGHNNSSSLGPTTGFGAFSSSGPDPFSTGFGFGAQSNPSPSPMVAATPTEDSMSPESTPSFGGLSLGGPTDSNSKPESTFGLGPTGIFGASAQSPPDVAKTASNSASSSNAFGAIKPATGFGAFASFSSGTPPSSTLSATSATPASAFGRSGFDTKPSTTFGQSSFGPTSTPAFGQSGFGSAAAPPPSASSSGGGFSAFAQGGLASFGSSVKSGEEKSFVSGANFGGSTFGSISSKAGELGGNAGQSSVFGGGGPAFGSPQPKASGDIFGGGSTFLGSKSVSDPTVQPTGGSNVFGGGSFAASGAEDSLSSGLASSNHSDVFGQRPGLDTMSRKDPSLSPETVSPTMVTLNASASPVLATKAPSPFGSIGSTPSPFKSSSPTPGFGAFGQLKSSNHGFMKPAEGFGAFGGSPSSQSPFLNPPKAEEIKPVSVFGAAPPKTATLSTPTFGSTSAIRPSTGSQFGSTVLPPAALPKATASTSGGFAAFSSSSSTFGQLADSKKSFTELLKGGDDAKDPTKLSTVPSKEPTLSSKEKDEPKEAHLPADGNVPALPESSKLSPSNEDKKTLSSEPSTVSLSSSDSSFVEVVASGDEVLEPTGNEIGNDSEVRSHNGESDQHDLEDDTQSFLSDSQSEGSSEENPEGETILDIPIPEETEPTTPAKPGSAPRSPSTTPKADPVKIDIRIPSPPPSVPVIAQPEAELPSLDASTTPPGSPAKATPALGVLAKTPPPLSTTTAPGTTTPSGLGLGRPSTRPARSSPLASVAPLLGATDEEEILPTSLAKPTIAAPKSLFGVLPTFTDSAKPALRPKTPPLLSAMPPKLFDLDAPSSTSAPPKQPGDTIVTPPSTQESEQPALFSVPSTPAPFSSFGAKAAPSPSPSAGFRADSAPPTISTPPPFSLLGNKLSLSSSSSSISGVQAPTPSARPLNSFGPRPPEATPSAPLGFPDLSSSNSAPPSIFSHKASTPLATSTGALGTQPSNVFSNKLATTSPAPGPKASVTPSLVSPAPEPNREQGMQTECLLLFATIGKELEGLKNLAQDVSRRRIELGKPLAGHRSKEDLGDPSKWGLGDIVLYGQTLKQLESDIAELEKQRIQQILTLRKLESGMLKAKTRQEEILRFKNARRDVEFAKMLKLRSLGPEHIETQMQLRRDIRTMGDRVQKLEDKLEESKKKLNEVKLGKPTFRSPSLDTINRVCRQIDIAIAQRTEEIAKLSARIAEIHLSIEGLPSSTRDKRLPEASFKKPVNVTPNIAVSTAAALNAERSAQKLKRALLSVRQEPLLNTRAASAPIPPVAFTTPMKASGVKPEPIPFDLTSLTSNTFATPNQPIPQDWTLSATPTYNESPSPSLRIRTSAGSKYHTKPVPLRKSASSGQSPTPATFDWGPLATVRSMATLSADVRPRENT